MSDTPPPLPDRHETPRYAGDGAGIFRLAMVTGLLTFLTLGIYRFWAKTRIRRYIWSAAELDGSRFEYTGTGVEKLLGFLAAVVILAVYLGLVQIALVFVGLNLFSDPDTPREAIAQSAAFALTFAATVPLLFFAIYRARRYKLARTRWRGIRFGMDKGAWGYALRAIGYWALTLGTIGILLPLQTFRLNKYMVDRSWFGDARFRQDGRWTDLYRAMTQLFVGLGILFVVGGIGAATESPGLVAISSIVGAVWTVIGVVSYRVRSFAYLASHTVLEDGRIGLASAPSTSTVIRTYIVGSLAIAIGLAVVSGVLTGILSVLFGGLFQMLEAAAESGDLPFAALAGPVAVGALSYLAFALIAAAATLALITQPILAHYLTTLTVRNVGAVRDIRQRAADQGADAEGFADALDIGGAI